MGYIKKSAYRVETDGRNAATGDRRVWDVKRFGAPNAANLERWVQVTNDSYTAAGCNAHLGRSSHLSARIVRQDTARIVAKWSPTVTFRI